VEEIEEAKIFQPLNDKRREGWDVTVFSGSHAWNTGSDGNANQPSKKDC